MNLIKLPALTVALLCAGFASAPQADLFGDLKNKLKKETKKEANKKVRKEVKAAAKTTSRKTVKSSSTNGSTVSLSESPSADLVKMTRCSDLKLESVTTGYMGDYTFQQGFSKESRSGFVKRKPGKVSNGCVLPSLQSRQLAYMEVDSKAFDAMGSSNDWQMQCIRSDKPSAGALTEKESRTEAPYHTSVLSGKDVLLFCGNSEGVEECAEGSNSQRSGKWSKKLSARGKTMLSVHAFTSTLAPAGGEKVYCQYYNKKSQKSLFAFEYLRLRK